MSQPYIGEIRLTAFNFAPQGWSLCNGITLPISENEALFNLLGTTYGGDGVNTFKLPDLQGRVPVHQGGGFTIGQSAGQNQQTLTLANLPAHTHTMKVNSDNQNVTTSATNHYISGVAESGESLVSTGYNKVTLNPATISKTGGNQPVSTTPPFVGINYIIALYGIFPTQN